MAATRIVLGTGKVLVAPVRRPLTRTPVRQLELEGTARPQKEFGPTPGTVSLTGTERSTRSNFKFRVVTGLPYVHERVPEVSPARCRRRYDLLTPFTNSPGPAARESSDPLGPAGSRPNYANN